MKNNSAMILFPVPADFTLDFYRFCLYFVVVYLGLKMRFSLRVPIGEHVWRIKGISQRKHERLEWTSVEVEKNIKIAIVIIILALVCGLLPG